MTEKKLQQEVNKIRKGMRFLDDMVHVDYKTGKGHLTKKQTSIVQKLFKLLRVLGWTVNFNNYKELRYSTAEIIDKRKCGTLVKVRPCGDKYKNQTYLGILLGDLALSIRHTVDKKGIVTAEHSHYNPAIFIPALKDIVYGCGSWWSEIENEEQLKQITNNDIDNVWYVKALKKQIQKQS